MKLKKVLSIVLVAVMLLSVVPFTASAANRVTFVYDRFESTFPAWAVNGYNGWYAQRWYDPSPQEGYFSLYNEGGAKDDDTWRDYDVERAINTSDPVVYTNLTLSFWYQVWWHWDDSAYGFDGQAELDVYYYHNGSWHLALRASEETREWTYFSCSIPDGTTALRLRNHSRNRGHVFVDTLKIEGDDTRVNPVVTAPTAKSLYYNAQPQTLVTAGSTTGGTLLYSLDDLNYSANVPTATYPGPYTVYYKVQGNPNYFDLAPQTVAVTINRTATITYNLNGGNIGGSTADKTEYLKSGDTLATTFSTPQRTNYVFKGWYTAASGGTKVTACDTTWDTTYYAQWYRHSVTLNGGNNATPSGGSVYQMCTEEMTTVTYTAKSGYYFKQSDFPISSNGITATWKSDTTVEVAGTPTSSVSLTVPEAKPHSVTLNGGNNATPSGGSVYQEPGPAAMTTVTYTANSGYYFKQSDFPKSSNGITATWKSDTTVEVTGTPTTDVSLTVPDAKPHVSITTAPTANELTETGYYQNLVSAGSASGGTMYYAVTTENTMPDASSYSTTIPTGRGAGTYYVWYKTVGDENHIDTTPASVTVTLNEAELTDEPTVSFTEISSLGDITENNIKTCTFAEAKSWIVANWDDVVAGAGVEIVKVAYYNSDTDDLNVWSLKGWESKDKFLNNSYDYFREQGSIDDLQQCNEDGEYVYLCGEPAPEPTYTVSFTKFSGSFLDITEDKIDTSTMEEAATWIVENWDSIEYGPSGSAYFTYYSGDSLCAFRVSNSITKAEFEDNYSSLNFSSTGILIYDVQDHLQMDNDTVYLCTHAAPEPEPAASTVSFEKVTSTGEITAEDIDTCTMEEAKAWILENWNSIEFSYWGSTYFAYYSGDSLCAFRLSNNTYKNDFERDYSSLDYSVNGFNLSNVNIWDDTVYLCKTATAAARTVSFTPVTSADEITDNNISTCTDDEAIAWILANWDNVVGVDKVADFVYHNSDNGHLNAFHLHNLNPESDFDKNQFSNDPKSHMYFSQNVTAAESYNWYGTGDTVYLCQAATAVADPVVNNIYSDGFVTLSELSVGDVVVQGVMSLQTDNCTVVLNGGRYGQGSAFLGELNQVCTESLTLDRPQIACSPYMQFGNMGSGGSYVPVDANGNIANAFIVMAKDGNTLTIAGIKLYTITWEDGDNNTLATEMYGSGTIPSYKGATPTKESTAEYNYTFAGWSDGTTTYAANEIPAVTGDATYTAQFNQTTRKYKIIWKSDASTIIGLTKVAYDGSPYYAAPASYEDAQYIYTFAGWSDGTTTHPTNDMPRVTGDATYTAQFNRTTRNYTITWKSDANTVIDTTQVAYGATPTHAAAAGYEDAENTYTFAGWTPEVTAVTGEATYTAVYTATPKTPAEPTYTVTWKNGDTTLETDTDVAEGTTPTYNGETPTKAEDENYTYTFSGWDDGTTSYGLSDTLPNVTANVTYTATFEATPKTPAPAEPNNGTNITVADTISENFYLDGDYYGADAYVTVNYNHNSNLSETPNFNTDDPQMLSEMDKISGGVYDGNSIISVIQAPAQSTEPITINVYATEADAQAGKNPVDTIEYCVYDYCREILTGEYSDGWKELAETTLDYCAAAQNYFGYNTGNMATKDNGGAYYNDISSADFSGVANIVKPACIKKASMVVKSDLEINLLSLSSITVTGASMDADKGKDRFSVSDSVNGDYYEVNIKGIVPSNMNKTITITTSEGEIVLTANAIMKIMANSSNANLANMAKAMYLYGAAAYNCFD